jgi:hypothetical protein
MLTKVGIFVLGLSLGILGTMALLCLPRHNWMPLTRDGQGLAWMNDAFVDADIPFPETTSPEGKAKFVDRGVGRGIELGFLVKTKMGKLDTSKLPAKYKKTEKHGEFTFGPTDTVVYTSHVQFTLKDADGFTLISTSSEPMEVWSGQENVLQGFGKDPIPDALVRRTKSIEMELMFDKCDTCRP